MDPISINYDKEAEEDDGSCLYGGSGGNVSVVARLYHHDSLIVALPSYRDTVFVKYNSESSSSTFDAYFIGDTAEDHVHINGLKPGKYFFRGVGFDPRINQRVVGGVPLTITQSSGEINLNIPVTE